MLFTTGNCLAGLALCMCALLQCGQGFPMRQTATPEITLSEATAFEFTTPESTTSFQSTTFDSDTTLFKFETQASTTFDSTALESTTVESATLVESETFESTSRESTTIDESETFESTTLDSATLESETFESTTLDSATLESETFEPTTRYSSSTFHSVAETPESITTHDESIVISSSAPDDNPIVTLDTTKTPSSATTAPSGGNIFTMMATAVTSNQRIPLMAATDPLKLYDLYTFLLQASITLSKKQKELYDEYKIDRFNNSDIRLPPLPMFRVDGLPDLEELTIEKRLSMTEEQLLTTHRRNLFGYKYAIEEVQIDEAQQMSYPRNFGPDLKFIEDSTMHVLDRLDNVLSELNYPDNPEDSIPPVVFEPEDSEAMRNLRDLYILQEMFHYLIILVQQDLPRLQETHAPVEPRPTATVIPLTVRVPDINDLYRGLVQETTAIHQFHRDVYLQYKEDRFDGYDVEPRFDIPGLPNISKLSATIRYRMTVEHLLTTHRINLYSYKQAMTFVTADEVISNSPNDFTERFRSIGSMLTQVIENQEHLMAALGIVIDSPSPPQMVFIEPLGSEVLRNLQDFQILQEIHRYLPLILQDIDRLQVGQVGFEE